MSKEAMKLALEALEYIANETYDPWTNGAEAGRIAQTTLSKIKNKCRAIQTSDQMTCECGNVWDINDPYPPKCTALREALASEAKEHPAQQEPVQNNPFDCGVYLGSGKDHVIKHHVSYGPAQQEPVAWTNWRELVGARHYRTPGWEMYADKRNPDDVAIYTSPPAQQEPFGFAVMENPIAPPAQRTWVGLTKDDATQIQRNMVYQNQPFSKVIEAIEAKLRKKNT